jgi:dihydroflavonol-4-reductase
VVYTSTESTVGIHGDAPGTEETPAEESQVSGHYKKSKIRAEKLALKANQAGLPVVVVNPTMPVGPFDVKPTPSGQVIVDFLNRRMPAWVDTGLNVVDVEDVAKGHVLALERGRAGERYLLGNRNLTFREILSLLEGLSGLKAPAMRIPLWIALGTAYVDEVVRGRILGRTPGVCTAAVKTAKKIRHFDCSKAVRELGLPQSPIEKACKKAIHWFLENGYVKHGEIKGMSIEGERHAQRRDHGCRRHV